MDFVRNIFLMVLVIFSQVALAGKNKTKKHSQSKSVKASSSNSSSSSSSKGSNNINDEGTEVVGDTSDRASNHQKAKSKSSSSPDKIAGVALGGSAKIRSQNRFSAELKSLALSDFFLKNGFGLNYGLNADLETSLTAFNGSRDLTDSVPSDEFVDVLGLYTSALLVSVNARYFLGNSFSALGGLGYRRAVMDAKIAAKQSDFEVEFALKVENLVLFSAIGNHWSFDNGITLGCDWIAISVPLTKSWKSTLSTTGFSDSEVASLDQTISDLGMKVSGMTAASIGIVSLGYRF